MSTLRSFHRKRKETKHTHLDVLEGLKRFRQGMSHRRSVMRPVPSVRHDEAVSEASHRWNRSLSFHNKTRVRLMVQTRNQSFSHYNDDEADRCDAFRFPCETRSRDEVWRESDTEGAVNDPVDGGEDSDDGGPPEQCSITESRKDGLEKQVELGRVQVELEKERSVRRARDQTPGTNTSVKSRDQDVSSDPRRLPEHVLNHLATAPQQRPPIKEHDELGERACQRIVLEETLSERDRYGQVVHENLCVTWLDTSDNEIDVDDTIRPNARGPLMMKSESERMERMLLARRNGTINWSALREHISDLSSAHQRHGCEQNRSGLPHFRAKRLRSCQASASPHDRNATIGPAAIFSSKPHVHRP